MGGDIPWDLTGYGSAGSALQPAPDDVWQLATGTSPAWDQSVPAAGGSGSGTGNWGQQLAGALKNLGGDVQKQQQQQQQQQQMRQMQLAQSQARGGGGGAGLGQLLQMLNQRTNMYLGATNPQTAQPQMPQRTAGLLGI